MNSVTMHKDSRTRVSIYAVNRDGSAGDLLTTGFLIQRWLGLALAPLDEPLSELGAVAGPDGGLRVRTAIDDGSSDETIDATVYFNDPGQGMLAFLLLDRASLCPSDPLPPLDRPDPTEDDVAASISAYVLARGLPATRSASPAPVASAPPPAAARDVAPDVYPDALLGPDWPRPHGPLVVGRPPSWPPALPWPPDWDDDSIIKQICRACPCLIFCPPCRGAD